MNEDHTYVDTAEAITDLVDTWSRLITAAVEERYGADAGRYVTAQTDLLRTTLMEVLNESHRIVVKNAQLTHIDGIPLSLIEAVNEIEKTEGDTS